MADYTLVCTLGPSGTISFSPSSLTIDVGDRVRLQANGFYNNLSLTASGFASIWSSTANISLSNAGSQSSYKTANSSGSDSISVSMSGLDPELKTTVSDSSSFTITVASAVDTTPNAFSLGSDKTGQALNNYVYSSTATITGINAAATVTISGTGAQFQVNGGSWRTSSTTVSNNGTVRVRILTSSTASLNKRTATLTVGGVSDSFAVTTGDAEPVNVTATAIPSATLSTSYETSYGVSGINIPSTLTATGCTFSVNGGSFVSSGSVSNGDTITVKDTSSSSYSTLVSCNLKSPSGAICFSWSITTRDAPSGNYVNLPTAVPIWLRTNIIETFGWTGSKTSATLRDYYRSGGIVLDQGTNSGIPTSGAIYLSDFLGSQAYYELSAATSFFQAAQDVVGTQAVIRWDEGTDYFIEPSPIRNVLEWRITGHSFLRNGTYDSLTVTTSNVSTSWRDVSDAANNSFWFTINVTPTINGTYSCSVWGTFNLEIRHKKETGTVYSKQFTYSAQLRDATSPPAP